MGRYDLICSNQWFLKFRERNNLRLGKLNGERASVNKELVEIWRKSEIPRMMINWQHEFIYNCDETSLFWRQVPDKTYFISKTEHVGDKLFHERISILFCVNRKGEKLSPLAIGKAVKPRCFYKDCLISLDLNYVSQTNAWMDRDTFNFWLSSWHKTLAN